MHLMALHYHIAFPSVITSHYITVLHGICSKITMNYHALPWLPSTSLCFIPHSFVTRHHTALGHIAQSRRRTTDNVAQQYKSCTILRAGASCYTLHWQIIEIIGVDPVALRNILWHNVAYYITNHHCISNERQLISLAYLTSVHLSLPDNVSHNIMSHHITLEYVTSRGITWHYTLHLNPIEFDSAFSWCTHCVSLLHTPHFILFRYMPWHHKPPLVVFHNHFLIPCALHCITECSKLHVHQIPLSFKIQYCALHQIKLKLQ